MLTSVLAQTTSFEWGDVYFNPFYVIVNLVSLGLAIFLLVDVLRRPDWVWNASGQNKVLWIVLGIVGICCGFGWLFFLIYWFAIRPKVEAAQQGGGPGYGGTGYA